MYEISCEMCRDLLPLVKDGIAGADSRAAVEAHAAQCPACRTLLEAPAVPADGKALCADLKRRVRLLWAAVMLVGILIGTGLTGGSNLFYNVLLMPVIGGVSCFVFRWRALYLVPPLLLGVSLLNDLMALLQGGEVLGLPSLLLWTLLYCGFALAGFVIAALLRFALGKEKPHE